MKSNEMRVTVQVMMGTKCHVVDRVMRDIEYDDYGFVCGHIQYNHQTLCVTKAVGGGYIATLY